MFDENRMPENGWDCVLFGDMSTEPCEMCDRKKLRRLYVMEHSELPLTVMMCRKCAERSSGDGDAFLPRLRERQLKDSERSRANGRRKWVKAGWRLSRKGNQYRNVMGKNVGIVKRGSAYGYWCRRETTHHGARARPRDFSVAVYATAEEAKLALFDKLFPVRFFKNQQRSVSQ